MTKKIVNRFTRAPIPAIAVLLFAAVVSVIICALKASNDAELRNYEEMWQSAPITVTVTAPSGINSDGFIIQPWVLALFTEQDSVDIFDVSDAENDEDRHALIWNGKAPIIEGTLTEYVKDVQVRAQRVINKVNTKNYKSPHLIGITSLSCDKQLLPEYGCEITWRDGYDESIFEGDEQVCIIPADTVEDYDNGNGEAVLDFANTGTLVITMVDGNPVVEVKKTEHQCTLKIVGTYTAGDGKSIYCPYPIVEQVVVNELQEPLFIYSLSATLADNSRLDEFREKMSLCFTEPSPDAEGSPWVRTVKYNNLSHNYESYPYALDINDDNLFDLSAILENSIKFNRTVTLIIVALSVVSGLLVGFLMIRRRKRDIMLMRTVGESNARVYFGFVLEQMTCIILGVVVGGAYNMWKPIDKLLVFAIVYFAALSLALIIFMSKKLIKNIKEDE